MYAAPLMLMTPIERLPDEILREILLLLLSVSSDAFAKPATRFGQRAFSSSRYLTVCTRWTRIGTPLFYQTVILRSPAQTRALCATLCQFPELGLLVRKLRLEEGAYCTAIEGVAERTPRVNDLFVSLVIYSETKVSGLCRALDSLNPRKLVLRDLGSTVLGNQALDRVIGSICNVVKRSNHLHTVEWRIPWRSKPFTIPRTVVLAEALAEASNLHIVAVSGSCNKELPYFVEKITDSCSLQVYVVKCPRRLKKKIRAGLLVNPDAKRRVVFCDKFSGTVPQKAGVSLYPEIMDSKKKHVLLPKLPDDIWSRVIELVLTSYEMADETLFSDGLGVTEYPAFNKMCRSLTLVSRLFHSVALPFRPHNIGLSGSTGINLAGHVFNELAQNRSIRFLVHSLHLDTITLADIAPELGFGVVDIICRLHNLKSLTMPVRPADIRAIAKHLGHTLRKFDAYLDSRNGAGEAFIPSDWVGFSSLEALWLRPGKCIAVSARDVTETKLVSMRRLRTLTVQDYEDSQVFELLSHWDLRNTKRLNIASSPDVSADLARAHSVISSLLETGSVEILAAGNWQQNPDIELLKCIPTNDTVKKIILCFEYTPNAAHRDPFVLELFQKAEFGSRFRALKEIQILSQRSWPYTESEIRRSIWPNLLDGLIQNHAVKVTNLQGAPWRPRLRLGPAS
ncbi:hypothetical protein DFH11DRAFT_1857584 [Phellopilus nigrolimitatus]|nr:hypothetical protein DFH11DRAFT_1857584 [Phellopilus nigrolimitatus]